MKAPTNSKISSTTEANHARCRKKTLLLKPSTAHLPRPSMNITTKDIVINTEPVTTNQVPARSAK